MDASLRMLQGCMLGEITSPRISRVSLIPIMAQLQAAEVGSERIVIAVIIPFGNTVCSVLVRVIVSFLTVHHARMVHVCVGHCEVGVEVDVTMKWKRNTMDS